MWPQAGAGAIWHISSVVFRYFVDDANKAYELTRVSRNCERRYIYLCFPVLRDRGSGARAAQWPVCPSVEISGDRCPVSGGLFTELRGHGSDFHNIVNTGFSQIH